MTLYFLCYALSAIGSDSSDEVQPSKTNGLKLRCVFYGTSTPRYKSKWTISLDEKGEPCDVDKD